jgi:hypothetical protein
MAVAPQPQISIDERVVESPALEASLEAREVAKAALAEARAAFKVEDDKARGLIAELELGEAPARVGRFRLVVRPVEARSVAFDTDPTTRLTITPDREEAF